MVVAIFRLNLPPYDEELCIKILGNAQILKLTHLDFSLLKVS